MKMPKFMEEERLLNVDLNKSNELIWTLEHPDIYTAGQAIKSDILDKSIKILKQIEVEKLHIMDQDN